MSRQRAVNNGSDFAPVGLTIKVRLSDDIRRIPILNEDLTYDELVLMMQRVFRGKLSGSDAVVIKYTDIDGDLVTIADSSDLSFAIENCQSLLNLTLFVNGVSHLRRETTEVRLLRAELMTFRSQVESLIDRLDGMSTSTAAVAADGGSRDGEASGCTAASAADGTQHASRPTQILSPASGREFDPLTSQQQHRSSFDENTQQKVLNAFGLSAASAVVDGLKRSDTPDSVGSTGHTARPQQQQQQQYAGPPVYASYADQSQPVQTGYVQSQPVQSGYGQTQAGGYSVAQQHAAALQQDQYGGQYAMQPAAVPGSLQGSTGGAPLPATNPYSRASPYGVPYPRPQGQFPQSS